MQKETDMRQLLKNARVYDGTGSEPRKADILLEEDRIAVISERIDLPSDSVIDLSGKSVSSGFIDAHSHNDWFAIKKDPFPPAGDHHVHRRELRHQRDRL